MTNPSKSCGTAGTNNHRRVDKCRIYACIDERTTYFRLGHVSPPFAGAPPPSLDYTMAPYFAAIAALGANSAKAAALAIGQQNDHHPLTKSSGKPEAPLIATPTSLPVIRPLAHFPGMESPFHVPTKHLNP